MCVSESFHSHPHTFQGIQEKRLGENLCSIQKLSPQSNKSCRSHRDVEVTCMSMIVVNVYQRPCVCSSVWSSEAAVFPPPWSSSSSFPSHCFSRTLRSTLSEPHPLPFPVCEVENRLRSALLLFPPISLLLFLVLSFHAPLLFKQTCFSQFSGCLVTLYLMYKLTTVSPVCRWQPSGRSW